MDDREGCQKPSHVHISRELLEATTAMKQVDLWAMALGRPPDARFDGRDDLVHVEEPHQPTAHGTRHIRVAGDDPTSDHRTQTRVRKRPVSPLFELNVEAP